LTWVVDWGHHWQARLLSLSGELPSTTRMEGSKDRQAD